MNTNSRNTSRLGRRLVKQGLHPLPSDQGRVEKLATGKSTSMKGKRATTEKLKIAKNTLTVGAWNIQTPRATGIPGLLKNEMKRFRYDIIGTSEVRWTEKDETLNRDFIWSEEVKTHVRGFGTLLSSRARKAFIGHSIGSLRVITASLDAAPYKITLIHACVSTMAFSDEDIVTFYSILEDTLAKIYMKNIIIIIGDEDAKIGSDNTN